MKLHKILIAAAVTLCATGFHALAAEESGSYPIYSTDILTMLDGIPIQGYNIGGQTMIALEDLADYGFTVSYDDSVRKLFVNKTHEPSEGFSPSIPRGTVGEIIGYVQDTDITAYVNGSYIETANIGGKLAAVVETLGENTYATNIYGIIYSPYYMSYTYNDAERCLYLSHLPDGELSYEDQIAAVYNYMDASLGEIRNINRIRSDEFDILTFEKLTHSHGYASHLMVFYHNGLYINMSEILSHGYQFSSAVDGGSESLTVFDGRLSEDRSAYTFDGDKYRFVSAGPGLHSTQYFASGNYSMDMKSGRVTTIYEDILE